MTGQMLNGYVTKEQVDVAVRGDEYSTMRAFADQFKRRHSQLLARYSGRWPKDPLTQWSRRFEYPFTASALGDGAGRRLLDAGAGFTFFPFYMSECRGWDVVACDADNLATLYEGVASKEVEFRRGFLENIPLPDASVDAVMCVSVLEHMDDPQTVVSEFARVLRPDGQLVVTMDICRDGRADIPLDRARVLLGMLTERFEPVLDHGVDDPWSPGVLSTTTSPRQQLPWWDGRLYGLYNDGRRKRLPMPKTIDLTCYALSARLRNR
jgi:SAM-dependent methyltransferase